VQRRAAKQAAANRHPRGRCDKVQEVLDQMNAASDPRSANAMSGPRQCPDNANRCKHGGKPAQVSVALSSSQVSSEQECEHGDQHQTHQPITAEIRLQQNNP
jgi:hypothetical protein